MAEYSIRDKVAIVGIGETKYYKRGQAPVSEFQLACEAITKAAEDAGIDVREIDGISGYANDRNEASRLATALGFKHLGFAGMVWGGGGGGGSAAVGNAAAAVNAGYSKYCVVFRALAQGQFGRFGQAPRSEYVSGAGAYTAPYGLFVPAQWVALRTHRFMHDYGINREPLAAVAMADYYHAQFNPRAVMYGNPLTREQYDKSRWISEPFHLYDCCMENDGSAALIVSTADRARDAKKKPAYIMAAAQGSAYRHYAQVENQFDFSSANFKTLAPRLFEMADIAPKDVDCAQIYEHFSGAVMISLVEHGFCKPEEVMEFVTFDNITAPKGKLPVNTSGGNIAECYMHGLELVNEAVRQVRGESTCQVPDCKISLVASGPMVCPVSDLIVHSI